MASKAVEVKLEPVDNQRLARLCGALDENLRQIESALDVTIARRGGKFTVRGEQAQRAAHALEHFYDRASGDLSVEDVQLGLTELSSNSPSQKAEGPQLLTRRSDLHGRTPHQVQYIESILAHDCTIGIGPAGTGKTYLAVACAVDALEQGMKVVISVRPEDIRLSETRPSGDNVLEGTVHTKVFLGESVDFEVRINERSVLSRAHPSLGTRVGHPIHLSLDPEKCVALKDTPE